MGEFEQIFKERKSPILHKHFHETEEEVTIRNSYCEARKNLVLNLDKKGYEKKKITEKYPS